VVVTIDDPSEGEYYGGLVAAPLFSTVMSGSLRLLNIAPDSYEGALVQTRTTAQDYSRTGGDQ
jgi:cell division protein FtsI (penicillin-binding protein 3)